MQHLVATVRKRDLVLDLARADFRSRYIGSLFGGVWAFANPLFTFLMYLFVYRVAFRGAPAMEGVSAVLWLIVGITPWFFFAEGLLGTTSAFTDYSFLVKKVPFDISVVPSIKLFSSAFVHIFVWLIVVGIVFASGVAPSIAWLQIIYYFFALALLISGIGLVTATIMPFFRDMSHVMAVVLQFLFWLTPIGWSTANIPPSYARLIELNPLFYIIEGLRDALLHGRPFWYRPTLAGYFWSFVLAIHVIGMLLFRRLRPHIADVL
jgi:teichoic acid transport system permease protein